MSPRFSRRVEPLRRTLIREIFETAPPDALNLGLGQPDIDAPMIMRRALAAAAASDPHGYGPTAGLLELRAAIADDYPGLARTAEDVLVTTGVQQATFAVLGCLLDPGDEILVPDPGFPGAGRAALAWSANARGYPLRAERGFHLDPDEVIEMADDRTRAVLVTSPSNPTGAVEPRESLDRLAEQTRRRGLALVLDDTYRGLAWEHESGAPSLAGGELDHVVVCGGLSKNLALTGWRVGWAICTDRDFMKKLIAMQQTILTCASTPIQRGALAAFSPEGRESARDIRERFAARARIVAGCLPPKRFSRAPIEGAFYAFINADQHGGGRAAARVLLEKDGIVVIPGEAFGDRCADWIRVSYAADSRTLERAFGAIAQRLS